MSRKPLKRRALRVLAIQALYQLDVSPEMHIVDALSLALECSEDSPYSIEAITEEDLINEVPEIAYSIALVLKRMEAKPYRSFRLNHHASSYLRNDFSRIRSSTNCSVKRSN